MIVLLVVLTVGWVLLAVFGAQGSRDGAVFYWTFLSVGTSFLVLVLLGVVTYLTLSIKAINLNRRQSNFIDSVTHELKSPIASLKLYLQTLNRHQVSQDERDNFNRYMLEDVERLDDLINHLLEAARLDKSPQDDELEDVELGTLLAQCAKTICLRYRLPDQTVQLKIESCSVRARRVDLDMLFRNLIDNAVKYSGNSPQVQISLKFSKDIAVIQISDNGSGIPQKLRRKIFSRFVRLGKELEREKSGTGLGLYIVRTLVSRLRGRISVHDGPGGQGTLFEVHLPAQILAERNNPTTAAPSTSESEAEVA